MGCNRGRDRSVEMLVSNCSCCQHIPPLDYFPTCPPSHPFHCCQCVPSCHFCQQNKLAFGYCVPSCSTCPVLPNDPNIDSDSGGTTKPDSSRTTTGKTGTGGGDGPTEPGSSGGKTGTGGGGPTEPGSSRTTGTGGGGPAESRGTEDIIQFPIPENPSWSNPKLYGWGFQHFLVNVGSTVIAPSVMVSVGGGGSVEKARAIQASLFVMGINTLLQICFGARLSVSMETSQAYIIPIISIALSTYISSRIWKAKKEIAGQVAIILSVAIVWTYAEILTVAGAYDNTTQETQMNCRTDSSGLIGAAPWIKTPHPFQWGTPIFEAGDALSMMAASLVAVIESSGTFYASSKLSGAPPIPPYALTRGIGIQGIGTMIDAVFGAGNGSTASV
ncbi:hypothetical protein GH714_009857 [Hevea brasiliensis]|uniref:Uncharacterized protein n=1 Tax=Hevea brasiliensis TaxID=3981 RepID=A0A6A6KZ89_HEVBR|nr:hypothetical protein GH714_009857 [Hevea brasiliensis]